MLDFIAEILGALFGSQAEKEALKKKWGIWTILLLILTFLMGTCGIWYLVKMTMSSSY